LILAVLLLYHNSFYVKYPLQNRLHNSFPLPTLPARKIGIPQKGGIYFLVCSATPSSQTMAEPTGSMELY